MHQTTFKEKIMKQIFLMFSFLITAFVGISQDKTNISAQVSNAKKKSGKQLIVSNPQLKLYAMIQNGKVGSYLAMDSVGNKLKISTNALGNTCAICIETTTKICYKVDCKDIPLPPVKFTRQ